MMGRTKKPSWLNLLLGRTFFHHCLDHHDLHKNEMNNYCVDCDVVMCHHCLQLPSFAFHTQRHHRLLKIRRYVYQNVIKIEDINKLTDCSKIQTFIVNSSKVVLLNPKQNCKNREGRVCEICQRGISEPFRFCSIACKVAEESGRDLQCSNSDDEDVSDSWKEPSLHPIASPQISKMSSSGSGLAIKGKISKRKGTPRRSFLF